MEYNIAMKSNNGWRRLDGTLRKSQANKKSKRSRMTAKKIFMEKKHNKKQKRAKLRMDIESLIKDIDY